MVSCLVWIHSDSDLLGLCYVSQCSNIMGREPQGQFVSACVCVSFDIVHVPFGVFFFTLPILLCIFVHACITFSNCPP